VGGPWEHRLASGDPGDEALTSRVIGRRQSLSQPRSDQRPRLGNLLLPEGRSVSGLVAEAVTAGFRRGGLRTRDPDRAPLADERSIHVEIDGFWGRMRPAIEIVRFESWIRIRLRAPGTPLADGATVCAVSLVTSVGPGAPVWRRTFESGLDDLSRRVAEAVQRGPPPFCVSP